MGCFSNIFRLGKKKPEDLNEIVEILDADTGIIERITLKEYLRRKY